MAESGVQLLVDDIVLAIADSGTGRFKSWKVVVASGTGTTALFLARSLARKYPDLDAEVVCAPCVENEVYLREKMKRLNCATGSFNIFPNILLTSRTPRRTFAKP